MGTPNPDIIRQNNLRILTNTLMLYVRMAFVMGINFFTTRELLLALGERDYGLVNVIGGVVSLFSFFASSMTTSVTRFFNYEIGKGDSRALKNTFNLVQIMYGGIVWRFLYYLRRLEFGCLKTSWIFPQQWRSPPLNFSNIQLRHF